MKIIMNEREKKGTIIVSVILAIIVAFVLGISLGFNGAESKYRTRIKHTQKSHEKEVERLCDQIERLENEVYALENGIPVYKNSIITANEINSYE